MPIQLLKKIFNLSQNDRVFCTSTNSSEYPNLQHFIKSGFLTKWQTRQDEFAGNFYNFSLTDLGRQRVFDTMDI